MDTENIYIDQSMMKQRGWNINVYLTALNAYMISKHKKKLPFISTGEYINVLVQE